MVIFCQKFFESRPIPVLATVSVSLAIFASYILLTFSSKILDRDMHSMFKCMSMFVQVAPVDDEFRLFFPQCMCENTYVVNVVQLCSIYFEQKASPFSITCANQQFLRLSFPQNHGFGYLYIEMLLEDFLLHWVQDQFLSKKSQDPFHFYC